MGTDECQTENEDRLVVRTILSVVSVSLRRTRCPSYVSSGVRKLLRLRSRHIRLSPFVCLIWVPLLCLGQILRRNLRGVTIAGPNQPCIMRVSRTDQSVARFRQRRGAGCRCPSGRKTNGILGVGNVQNHRRLCPLVNRELKALAVLSSQA